MPQDDNVFSSPFDSYPQDEFQESILKGSNCRHEYGLEYIRRTRQHHCAYCGVELTNRYEDWLTMVLDHVVPMSVCKRLGIDKAWRESLANTVLACGACNGFCNRYDLTIAAPTTFQEFIDLRNRIFEERKDLIRKRHEEEREFFLNFKRKFMQSPPLPSKAPPHATF